MAISNMIMKTFYRSATEVQQFYFCEKQKLVNRLSKTSGTSQYQDLEYNHDKFLSWTADIQKVDF